MLITLHTPSLHSGGTVPTGAAASAAALAQALAIAGHEVSRLDGPDDGDRLLQRSGPSGRRPDLWLTYGLRAEAPDQVGPAAARALQIPYVLVDPRGPEMAETGMEATAAVIALSDASAQWAASSLPDAPLHRLLPFIDPLPYDSVRRNHGPQEALINMRLRLDTETPKLLFVGAMRPGECLDSYRLLARALSRLAMLEWQLLVIGDGPARAEVETLLCGLPFGRTHLVGALPPGDVMPYYAICDLLVAPCVGGTHGRVLLEALATGLPVVAGDTPGVRDIVLDGTTGRLSPAGNAESIAQTTAFLLRNRQHLNTLAAATTLVISRDHHIVSAAAALDEILTSLMQVDAASA